MVSLLGVLLGNPSHKRSGVPRKQTEDPIDWRRVAIRIVDAMPFSVSQGLEKR
jgi:hypothetical protein